jgi:protein-L-isoaspartate O-methyltransferase
MPASSNHLFAELSEGAPKEAAFDEIFINGAVEAKLEALFVQLKAGEHLLTLTRLASNPSGRAGKAVRSTARPARSFLKGRGMHIFLRSPKLFSDRRSSHSSFI